MEKVLVFSPISDVKDYCMPQWLEHISNLTYPNYFIFLVDNSKEKNFFKKKYASVYPNIDYSWFNPEGLNSQAFIAESQERGRKYAINGNFDRIMSIECDVFPPLDVIERLMQTDGDVVSGVYNWNFGEKRKPLIQVPIHFNTYFKNRNMDFDEALFFLDGKNKEVFSAGIGCALIKRKVFNKISFRHEPNIDAHSDTFFCIDLYFNNFSFVLNTEVVCEHINQSWGYQEEITKYNNNYVSIRK